MEGLPEKFVPIENIAKMRPMEYFVYEVFDYSSRYNYIASLYYAPSNLIGKYEKYPSYGDFPEAYCLRSYGKWWRTSEGYQSSYRPQDFDPFGAEDYIIVRFEGAVVPRDICIYEVYNPGAVVRIWGKLSQVPNQSWIMLWEGPPETYPHKSRKFHPKIRQTNNLIDSVRLEFNQSHLEYHCSIDAVLLGGYQPISGLTSSIMWKGILTKMKPEKIVHNNANILRNMEGGGNLFSSLPDEVVLHIFQYLDLKSLSRCAQVNGRWNKISADSFLYHSLNLKPYWYLVDCDTVKYFMKKCKSLKKLDLSWCGNNVRGFEKVLAIFIGENSNSLTHISLGNCNYVNRNLLTKLSSCRELVDLRLKNTNYCSEPKVQTLDLFTKLVSLDLTSSAIRDYEFIDVLKANPHLKHVIIDLCEHLLQLDHIIEVAAEYNRQITTWSSWKTNSLTADGIRHFGKCPNLKDLDLGWCLINRDPGNCLNYIAEGCPKLKRLILSEWRGLNDDLVMNVIMSCKELTQIDFLGIKNISGEVCQKALLFLPKLRLLDISFCDSVRQDEVEIWRQQYPHIAIQRSCQFVSTDYLN